MAKFSGWTKKTRLSWRFMLPSGKLAGMSRITRVGDRWLAEVRTFPPASPSAETMFFSLQNSAKRWVNSRQKLISRRFYPHGKK